MKMEICDTGGEILGVASTSYVSPDTLAPVIPIRPSTAECLESVSSAKRALTEAEKRFNVDTIILEDSRAEMLRARNTLKLAIFRLLESLGAE
jgi:hypothetical protein